MGAGGVDGMSAAHERGSVIQRGDWVWLCVILSIAFTLRVIHLGNALWFDEIATLVEFVRLPTAQLMTSLTSMNNHLLYSLEAKAAISLFGESAWALRLPAMLFGVAGVAALWWFARRLVTASEANIAALLMAVSYHHIWFSQNARGYTELMFWAIAGTALFLQGIREPSWRVWIAYACVLAAAGYTHLSAVFFFGVHGLLYVYVAGLKIFSGRSISDLKPLAGLVLGGTLLVLLHAPMLPQIFHHVTTMSAPPTPEQASPEWKNPVWTILEVLRNLRGLGLIASLAVPAVAVFTVIGTISVGRRHPLFVATFLIHIPLTLILLLILSFRIWPRYFFIDLGFVLVCVVRGVFVASAYLAKFVAAPTSKFSKPETLGLAASGLAVVCSLFLVPPLYRFPKQDFIGARNFVESRRAAQDSVASVGLASYAFSKYYAPQWRTVESWRDVQQLRSGSAHVWLVYTSEMQATASYPEILKGLASEFELIASFPGTLGDGTVFVYRSRELAYAEP
jgi:mannosyltransferase